MISLDPYVVEFVNGNWLTLSLALGALKIVSVLTPGTEDDKIYTLLTNLFGSLRRRQKDV